MVLRPKPRKILSHSIRKRWLKGHAFHLDPISSLRRPLSILTQFRQYAVINAPASEQSKKRVDNDVPPTDYTPLFRAQLFENLRVGSASPRSARFRKRFSFKYDRIGVSLEATPPVLPNSGFGSGLFGSATNSTTVVQQATTDTQPQTHLSTHPETQHPQTPLTSSAKEAPAMSSSSDYYDPLEVEDPSNPSVPLHSSPSPPSPSPSPSYVTPAGYVGPPAHGHWTPDTARDSSMLRFEVPRNEVGRNARDNVDSNNSVLKNQNENTTSNATPADPKVSSEANPSANPSTTSSKPRPNAPSADNNSSASGSSKSGGPLLQIS